MKNWKRIVPILLALVLLAGCGQTAQLPATPDPELSATGTPSLANSPTGEPPVASSPAVAPFSAANSPEPVGEPSPASEPPAVEPPVSEPPVAQPSASKPPASEPPAQTDILQAAYIDPVQMPEELDLTNEAVALSASPLALHDLILPEASGVLAEKTAEAELDYSNAGDGYIMLRYTAQTDKTIQIRMTAPNLEEPYKCYLTPGEWTAFPLAGGNGEYTMKVYRQTASGKYAVVLSLTFAVELKDEFAPFLRPNQYVDYAVAENTLAKAEELMGNVTDPLKKVEKAYQFVVYNFTYDREKAKTVQSGYVPVLDDVLEKKTGICFDYAALMTGMLRSQGVPCKLVLGFAGTQYHAWVSVWTEDYGWVDGVVYFDGHTWQLMDPTFASSASRKSEADAAKDMKFIGDGANYKTRYLY